MTELIFRERPSPNFGARHEGAEPDLVILHYTNMVSPDAALDRLCDPEAQVSAHYLIEPDGLVWRLVPEERRAWHAGVSFWGAPGLNCSKLDINSRSIGVELAHQGPDQNGVCAPFAEKQMRALERLLGAIMTRWAIPPEAVLGHSDVAPGRKLDPGEKFDWARLSRCGLAEATPDVRSLKFGPPSGGQSDAFCNALAQIGYGDWPQLDLLDAFRRRWRPQALDEPLETADVLVAQALAQRRAQRGD